jgi:hypothetical protein
MTSDILAGRGMPRRQRHGGDTLGHGGISAESMIVRSRKVREKRPATAYDQLKAKMLDGLFHVSNSRQRP